MSSIQTFKRALLLVTVVNSIEFAFSAGPPDVDKLQPWVTSIYYQGRYSCLGMLLSKIHVLCAPHCADRWVSAENITVKVSGGHAHQGQDTMINVQSFSMHPGYNGTTAAKTGAVTLLRLSRQVNMTSHPVRLPAGIQNIDKENCYATGRTGSMPVFVLKESACRNLMGTQVSTSAQNVYVCVKSVAGNQSICHYDGFLTCYQEDTQDWLVVGVTSPFMTLCHVNNTMVYIGTDYHRPWIRWKTGKYEAQVLRRKSNQTTGSTTASTGMSAGTQSNFTTLSLRPSTTTTASTRTSAGTQGNFSTGVPTSDPIYQLTAGEISVIAVSITFVVLLIATFCYRVYKTKRNIKNIEDDAPETPPAGNNAS